MPVPSLITDLSIVVGSNSPAGSETPGQGDDYLRVLSAFLAQLRDKLNGTSDTGTVKNPVFSGASTGTYTLGGTITISPAAITWSGNPTHSGNHTWSGPQTFTSAVTFNSNPLGRVTSGVYTPTWAAISNVSIITAGQCYWVRVGNVVSVSGSATITSNSAGNLSRARMTLPVASAFALQQDARGTATIGTSSPPYECGFVYGTAATDDATLEFFCSANSVGAQLVSFVYSYQVL